MWVYLIPSKHVHRANLDVYVAVFLTPVMPYDCYPPPDYLSEVETRWK